MGEVGVCECCVGCDECVSSVAGVGGDPNEALRLLEVGPLQFKPFARVALVRGDEAATVVWSVGGSWRVQKEPEGFDALLVGLPGVVAAELVPGAGGCDGDL